MIIIKLRIGFLVCKYFSHMEKFSISNKRRIYTNAFSMSRLYITYTVFSTYCIVFFFPLFITFFVCLCGSVCLMVYVCFHDIRKRTRWSRAANVLSARRDSRVVLSCASRVPKSYVEVCSSSLERRKKTLVSIVRLCIEETRTAKGIRTKSIRPSFLNRDASVPLLVALWQLSSQ